MKEKNSRLVYSTDRGRIKPEKVEPEIVKQGDGTLKIRLETKGRKGKGVTTISGLQLDTNEVQQLAKRLKQLCATGGSVKEGVIEIQGDNRQKLKQALESFGHTVKIS